MLIAGCADDPSSISCILRATTLSVMDNLLLPRDSLSPDAAAHPNGFHNFTLPPILSAPAFPHSRSAGIRNHLDTLRDVESAFHNADIALRHAREALRNDAIMSSRLNSASASGSNTNHSNSAGRNGSGDGNNVVDLTTLSSDTSNEDPEVQWSHTRHPNDPQPRARRTGATNHFTLRTPAATPFGAVGHLPHIRPHMPHIYPHPYQNHRSEETAIRRQRQARRDWERVERRNVERAALQAQRDAAEQARRTTDQAPATDVTASANIANTLTRRHSSDSTASSISRLSNDSVGSHDSNPNIPENTQGTTTSLDTTSETMPPTQSIDLTYLEDQPSLKEKLLSQQQQAAIAAQNATTANLSKDPDLSQPHATPLSTYRCAICMDTPTTATTTVCGHLFCHSCLKDSLKWSAQQRRDEAGLHNRRIPNTSHGLCPVCRKVLADKEGGNRPGIVGLEIKAVNRKEWERKKKQQKDDQERMEFLNNLSQSQQSGGSDKDKGKEREKDPADVVKMEAQHDEPGLGASRLTRGQVSRKRRRDEGGADYENSEGF